MARTILVIDDNLMIREVLRSMLESRGYKVRIAADGESGLEIFAQHAFDAALVDVDMPRMDGVEVCRALRINALAMGRPLLVWLMTGVRDSDLVVRALAAGACDVLAKPFTTAELLACFDREFQNQTAALPRAATVP